MSFGYALTALFAHRDRAAADRPGRPFLVVAQPLGVAAGIIAMYLGAPFDHSFLAALGFVSPAWR